MNGDNQALLNAIQGPIIMITVGTLFALDQHSNLRFGQTWPVILIVLGVLNLGRWTGRRQQP